MLTIFYALLTCQNGHLSRLLKLWSLSAPWNLGKPPDEIPTEFLTNNPSWWSTPLSNLFTIINKSGLIPATWLASVIVPIFKKGDPASPNNYWPINLLSFIGKLYSRYLLNKLISWTDLIGLPSREQIGFRPGSSTIDHIFALSFLASKYSEYHGTKLYSAFIDLRGAFDSIDRNILWRKLIKWGIDPCLLFLIQQLHSSNTCRSRVG